MSDIILCTVAVQSMTKNKKRQEKMKNNKILYSSGEFARLTGVNKRTLHYYNDIGIFCPDTTGENGYHYYTCFRAAELERILILRKAGLSLEEISEYTHPSADIQPEDFTEIIKSRQQSIDNTIAELSRIRDFLQNKSDKLNLSLSAKHCKIEKIVLPEQRIIFSDRISGRYDENDFTVAAQFSLRLKKMFGLYDNFGSCVSVEKLISKTDTDYDSFFAYCPDNCCEAACDYVMPAGSYLRSYCVGDWSRLDEVYDKIFEYADINGLRLKGYAFEEGLNEMFLKSPDEYVTMITIQCTS